jgi:hypothetical protein
MWGGRVLGKVEMADQAAQVIGGDQVRSLHAAKLGPCRIGTLNTNCSIPIELRLRPNIGYEASQVTQAATSESQVSEPTSHQVAAHTTLPLFGCCIVRGKPNHGWMRRGEQFRIIHSLTWLEQSVRYQPVTAGAGNARVPSVQRSQQL